MAVATKPKPKQTHHKKRTAAHHKQSKHYVKHYWPYLPMILVVVAGLLLSSVMNRPNAVLGAQSDLTRQALLESTNQNRSQTGVPDLAIDEALNKAAQAKADDMVARDYWSHETPDNEDPWGFIVRSGYQYQAAGENLAYGFSDASSVLNAWMHSPDHRANVTSKAYTEVGFGIAQATDYRGQGPETIVVAFYAVPTGDMTVTATVLPTFTNQQSEPVAISRVEASALPALSGFIVGVIGCLAVVTIVIRHGLAWRRLITRGEKFVLHHPLLDTVFVAVIMGTVLLMQTAGTIH